MSVKASNGYPFTTRRQIIDRIASEPAFVIECVHLIDGKWMASHKTRASKVLAKIAAGDLSPEDLVEAVALASSYARTISRILRERDLAARPELAAQAAVFGVVHPVTAVEAPPSVTAPVPVVVNTTETEVAPNVAPRKRGRPKGSRNKPKEESPPKRRRRS